MDPRQKDNNPSSFHILLRQSINPLYLILSFKKFKLASWFYNNNLTRSNGENMNFTVKEMDPDKIKS